MARNGSDPSSKNRRITAANTGPVRSSARTSQDRKRRWIQIMAALLVIAMLLPVVAVFVSLL